MRERSLLLDPANPTTVEAMPRMSLLSRTKGDEPADTTDGLAPPPPSPPSNSKPASSRFSTLVPGKKRSAEKIGGGSIPSIKGSAVGLPTAPKRQRNTGWMIGGAALILVSGFTAASMAQSYTETVDVLVAAESIAKGEQLQAEDVEVVPIAAGQGEIQAIDPSGLEDLVGRIASGPIGAGSVLHPDQFAAVEAEEQMVTVGMALEHDEFPTSGLQRGDIVRLFDVGSGFGQDEATIAKEITIGEIVSVEPLRSGSQYHFAVRVKESTANIITSRVTQDALAIALAEFGSDADDVGRLAEVLEANEDVDPLDPAEPLEPGDPVVAEQAPDAAAVDAAVTEDDE